MQRIDLIEAARLLAVPYSTAHRFALVGKLKAERVDGRWRVDAQSVERILRERPETEWDAA